MRLGFYALLVCLACDSGAPKVVAVPSSGASPPAAPSREGASPLPPSPPPSSPNRDGDPAEPRFEGEPDCRFQRPAVWTGGQVTWVGSCQKGFADGNGVIVNVVEGTEPERFYGRLERGSPSVGVLQTDSGFLAGRWARGTVAAALTDDVAQRNVVIDAFQVAATAASAVSKSFAQKKDAESNSFYAKQARLLEEQMD
jgi:hypothetical protein